MRKVVPLGWISWRVGNATSLSNTLQLLAPTTLPHTEKLPFHSGWSSRLKKNSLVPVINETAPLLLFNLGSKGSSLFSWRPHENSPPCSNAYLSPSPSVRGRTEKIPNDISNQVQATWWSSTSLGLGKNWLQKITMGRCIELPYPSHKDFGDRAFASTPFSCTRVAIIIGFTRRFCPVNATTIKEASTC